MLKCIIFGVMIGTLDLLLTVSKNLFYMNPCHKFSGDAKITASPSVSPLLAATNPVDFYHN